MASAGSHTKRRFHAQPQRRRQAHVMANLWSAGRSTTVSQKQNKTDTFQRHHIHESRVHIHSAQQEMASAIITPDRNTSPPPTFPPLSLDYFVDEEISCFCPHRKSGGGGGICMRTELKSVSCVGGGWEQLMDWRRKP